MATRKKKPTPEQKLEQELIQETAPEPEPAPEPPPAPKTGRIYPSLLYNKDGGTRVAHSAEEQAELNEQGYHYTPVRKETKRT